MENGNLTLKEVFERLIVMETKLTAMSDDSKKTKRAFQSYVLIMVILLITNIAIITIHLIEIIM